MGVVFQAKRGRRPTLSTSEIEQSVELVKAGYSYGEVGRRFNVEAGVIRYPCMKIGVRSTQTYRRTTKEEVKKILSLVSRGRSFREV